jgi:hypothetical protein
MHDSPIEERIDICKSTRLMAINTLKSVLQTVLQDDERVSESSFRDRWLDELRKSKEIFQDGWYNPPPYGIAVLFGKDSEGDRCRLNYGSLRPEEKWPSDNVYLDKNGLIYAYASPVNRETCIFGDVGVTIYLGKDDKIKKHLRDCLDINKELFEGIEDGMSFSDVAQSLKSLLRDRGMNNEIVCLTSPSSADDVGHTVPGIADRWSPVERKAIESGDDVQIRELISKKRIFVRVNENHLVKPGVAFTIEPRPRVIDDPQIPMASYHSIFFEHEDGEKELFTGFEDIFKVTGMEYMF